MTQYIIDQLQDNNDFQAIDCTGTDNYVHFHCSCTDTVDGHHEGIKLLKI